jgi:hypothetical protein
VQELNHYYSAEEGGLKVLMAHGSSELIAAGMCYCVGFVDDQKT